MAAQHKARNIHLHIHMVIHQQCMAQSHYLGGQAPTQVFATWSPTFCWLSACTCASLFGTLFLILYPALPSPRLPRRRLPQLCHTHTHTLFHTQLCHTPSFTHNLVTHTHHLSHTIFHTHNFVIHSLSRTTLSHTIFHTQLCHALFHTQLCHTPSFTHIHLRFAWQGWRLSDIHLRLAWQAWHFWHWAGSGGALGCR